MIVVCRACGRKNRVSPEHLADLGRCGACKQEIPPRNEPIDAEPDTFDKIVSAAGVPILGDFWAAWCAPCPMAAPEVKQTAEEMAGCALVLKVR